MDRNSSGYRRATARSTHTDDKRASSPYPATVRRIQLLLALASASMLACSTREPPRSEPDPAPAREGADERAPLVTVELSIVDEAAREQLVARLGTASPVGQADALLAVHHHIADGWHIYWRNPGESGLRTNIEVKAQAAQVGEVLFPGPEQFEASGLVSYGWGHEAVLFVPLRELGDDASVEVHSRYLACAESCIPGESKLEARVAELPRRADAATTAMLERVPEPAGDRITAVWLDGALQLRPHVEGLRIDAFYPYLIDAALLGRQLASDDGLTLHYRFTGSPPRDEGQGVLLVHIGEQAHWLELAAPWPGT